MRSLKLFIVMCLVHFSAVGTGVALASSLDCLQIHDSDRRHFCLAVTKPDKLECEFIRNSDLRAQCRASASPR